MAEVRVVMANFKGKGGPQMDATTPSLATSFGTPETVANVVANVAEVQLKNRRVQRKVVRSSSS